MPELDARQSSAAGSTAAVLASGHKNTDMTQVLDTGSAISATVTDTEAATATETTAEETQNKTTAKAPDTTIRQTQTSTEAPRKEETTVATTVTTTNPIISDSIMRGKQMPGRNFDFVYITINRADKTIVLKYNDSAVTHKIFYPEKSTLTEKNGSVDVCKSYTKNQLVFGYSSEDAYSTDMNVTLYFEDTEPVVITIPGV